MSDARAFIVKTLTFAMARVLLLHLFAIQAYKVLAVPAGKQETRGLLFTVEPPHKVEFSNNTGAEVRCVADGNSKPHITWKTKEGIAATDVSGLRYLRSDGTLVFPPFSMEDYRQEIHDTFYFCVATNSIGTIVSRDVQVRGVVQQKYVPQVHDDYIIRKNTGVLRCHLPSFVREYIVLDSWVRSDNTILRAAEVNGKGLYTILRSGELLVHDITDKISKFTYRCQTRHRLTGETVISSTSGRVLVTDPHTNSVPRITFTQPVIRIEEGETAIIPCVAQGFPSPTYRWKKETPGGLFFPEEDKRVLQVKGVLIIQKVRLTDGGNYQCFVSNRIGEKNADVVLVVSAPLSVSVLPSVQVLNIGEAATFNCTVKGNPIHTVVWKKDQRHLLTNNRIQLFSRDILHISSIRREDRGMYQCFAYNDQDAAQGTAQLKIGEVPPYLVSTFLEKTVHTGEFVSLSCVAAGNPIPKLIWALDGVHLASNQRVIIGDYSTTQGQKISYMNITETRIEDSGEYSCSASNDVGMIKHATRLNIYGSPFVRPIRNVSGVSGEDMTIQCPYGGYPIKSVSWQKSGILLPLNHRQKVSSNGTLMIHGVQRASDEGEYTCIARNADGQSAAASTYLYVVSAPVIDDHFFPERVTVDEGSRTKLMCSVSKGDPPIRFHWLKNSLPLSAHGNINIQMLEDSSFIMFRKVSSTDRGQYTCVATNTAASTNMTSNLIVNVPPEWRAEPRNLSTVLGKTVWMDCSAVGFPNPSVAWRKGREDTPGDFAYILSSSRVRQYSNGTLMIRDTEEGDGGFYLCQASNGIGAALGKVVYLHVQVPPKFEDYYKSSSVQEGANTTLKCVVKGDFPITLSWHKNKEVLTVHSDSRFSIKEVSEKSKLSSELTIHSASRHDTGLYTCSASNRFGSDETSIQLVVQGVPDSPSNLTVLNTTSRTATLSWEVPFSGNSHITGSVVQYKADSDNWKLHTSQLIVSGSESTATLRSLNPVTTYQVRVMAENSIGRSKPSSIINITTDVEAPSGPPRDLHVQATGAQSLKVSWKPPKEDLRHGKITGYYVGYKISDSAESYQFKHVADNRDEMSTYLTSLQPFTWYDVVLQAYNSAGPGPRSDKTMGKTLESAPPTSPILSVIETSVSSIDLKWEKDSKDKSTITEYTLHYKPDSGDWNQKKLSGYSDSYTLHGLRCGTKYHLYMTSSNSLGTGEPSSPVTIRTKGAAPMSPQEGVFLVPNITSVSLRLNFWQTGGCPIQHFSVQYRPKYDRQWTVVSEKVEQTRDKLEITGLAPNRDYNVMVTAYSEAGATQGEYQFRTLGSTFVAVTSSPALVRKEADIPFHKNLTLMIPVVVSGGVLLIVIMTVIVCTRKHNLDRNHRHNYQSRKSYNESMIMAEVAKKSPTKQGLDGSHYSSPTHRHSTSGHGLAHISKHEYAEPYSSVPPPRQVGGKDDFRSVDSQKHSEDGFATIKRYPTRPSFMSSAYKQGLDLNAHQMAAPDKNEYSSNSSHSEISGEKLSSLSNANQKHLR